MTSFRAFNSFQLSVAATFAFLLTGLILAHPANAQSLASYDVYVTTGTPKSGSTGEWMTGSEVWMRFAGTEGSTQKFKLGKMLSKGERKFSYTSKESDIGDVGVPLFIEIFLGKDGTAADAWYYGGFRIEYRKGRISHQTKFSEEGWLDDKEGSGQQTRRIWEDSLRGSRGLTETVEEVVDTGFWVRDNREYDHEQPLEFSSTHAITYEEYDELVKEKKSTTELSVSIGSEAFGAEWTAEHKSEVASGTVEKATDKSKVLAQTKVKEPIVVPANSVLIYEYKVVLKVEKTSYDAKGYAGQKLVRYLPLAGSLQKKYAKVSIFKKGQPVPQHFQKMIDQAKL